MLFEVAQNRRFDGLGARLGGEMSSPNEPTKTTPKTEEDAKKSKGMTRKAFGNLLKNVLSPPAPKPASKSS